MKIGILTFVNTTNYGASLQAYALQQVIVDQGHDCEIIRYFNDSVKNAHDPKAVFRHRGKRILVAPLLYLVYSARLKRFREFEEHYCKFSEQCDGSTIHIVSEKFDRIIVGSDQVWNPDITGEDLAFFLNFIENDEKKHSYAASIGTGYFKKDNEKYEKLIDCFKTISLRENVSVEELQKRLGRDDIYCNVDPTLLLYKRWNSFIKASNPYGDFVLVYLSPESEVLLDAVRQFAKKHNCNVLLLKKGVGIRKGIKIINVASPIDFINLVAHARYVVTGSFHAICFSIMLHKEFYATSAIETDRNSRVENILASFELERRIIKSPNYIFDDTIIDYCPIDEKIKEQVNQSLNIIQSICSTKNIGVDNDS